MDLFSGRIRCLKYDNGFRFSPSNCFFGIVNTSIFSRIFAVYINSTGVARGFVCTCVEKKNSHVLYSDSNFFLKKGNIFHGPLDSDSQNFISKCYNKSLNTNNFHEFFFFIYIICSKII